jgi:hypothetical protein
VALGIRAGAETGKKVVRMDLPRQQIVSWLRRAGLTEIADDAAATLPEQVPADVVERFCVSHDLSLSNLMDRMGASP